MARKLNVWSAQGRIGRKHYWLLIGVLVGISAASGFLPDSLKAVSSAVGLACAWPTICTYTKRLHDLGRSGWWQLAPLAFLVLGLLALMIGPSGVMVGLGVYLLGQFGFMIWLGCVPGQAKTNAYGPAPDAPQVDSEVFA